MRLLAALVLAFVLASCATGSAVVTGTKRVAIPSSAVQLYPKPPAEYEIIGVVRSSGAGWTEQESMNIAVEELKKQAAAIGANGLLLKSVGAYDGVASVVGEAINVRKGQ